MTRFLCQKTVAHELENPPMMTSNPGFKKLSASRSKMVKGSRILFVHKC
jgi:hypothetical protein